MRTLILDRYNHQPRLKQFIGNTLTGLGWAFWIYLWLPLITAIALLLGIHPEQVASTSDAAISILTLLATLASHAGMVVVMITIFFLWSLLQWLGKPYRMNALKKHRTKSPKPSVVSRLSPAEQSWHHAQTVIVSHDDADGFIKCVNIK